MLMSAFGESCGLARRCGVAMLLYNARETSKWRQCTKNVGHHPLPSTGSVSYNGSDKSRCFGAATDSVHALLPAPGTVAI